MAEQEFHFWDCIFYFYPCHEFKPAIEVFFSQSGGFSITFLIKYKEIKNFIYFLSFS